MTTKNIPAGLVCVGEQRISLTGTAKVALNSTISAAADVIVFSVETAGVRVGYSAVPAATTGVLYPAGSLVRIEVGSGVRFTAASGSPFVNVAGFRYANSVVGGK